MDIHCVWQLKQPHLRFPMVSDQLLFLLVHLLHDQQHRGRVRPDPVRR